nr:glycosyltransferase family 2 protein [Bacteroidota bacterium]
MERNSISVIISAYNGENCIANAIQSVINQILQPLEIIVVNDGSTDRTTEVLKTFGKQIKYIYKENTGLPAARNTGLKVARGEYITFLDQDDLYLGNTLQKQLEVFNHYKSLGVALGYSLVSKVSGPFHNDGLSTNTKKVPQFLLGCALIKKTVFDTVGFFDESLLMGEDLDMFLRIKEANIPFAIHDEVVMVYHRHDNNTTNDKRKAQFYLLMVIKKARERRKVLNIEEYANNMNMNNVEDAIKFWHTATLK